jgi:tryptophanyl-tRNA synthetase
LFFLIWLDFWARKIYNIAKDLTMNTDKKIILTGIKPTGTLHFGNYVGALKPLVQMAKTQTTFMFLADLHALNFMRDPAQIKQHTYEIAAFLMAAGLNLQNAVLFRQSDVAAVSQLSTLLMNVTPKGLMNRAHSYKDNVAKNIAAKNDPDDGINMGLYTYPVLMAADILIYNSDLVPVGKDQKQHVEFARDIAGYFNNIYGNILKLPEPVIGDDTGIIPGLDGRKMSKSYNNIIPIMATESELKKKIMQIITDSKLPNESKNPDESTIFLLYKHFATDSEIADFREKFVAGGFGYGELKTELFEKINSFIAPIRTEYERLMNNKSEIDAILNDGAKRASAVAATTLSRVQKAMLD